MHERIIEIIVYLIGEMNHNKSIDIVTFERLNDRGYSTTEISAAFSWLLDRMQLGDHSIGSDEIAGSKSFRFLNDGEREIISSEVYGYLLQLYELGLLNNEHVEMILERCIVAGYQTIGIAQINSIIASLFFHTDSAQSFGSRVLLNGQDTIH